MSRAAIVPEDFPYYDHRGLSFSLGVEEGGTVYLSGHTAARFDPTRGRIVVEGDIVQQARLAYEKVGLLLGTAGLSHADVVRVVEYVAEPALDAYAGVHDIRAELFGDAQPTMSTVAVRALLRPGALIEVEVTARRKRPPSTPATADEALLHLPSISGTDAGARAGESPEGRLLAQTEAAYAAASGLLDAAGLDWGHVVKTTEFVREDALPTYRRTADMRRRIFAGAYPAATGIVMRRLAQPDALIQIEFTASHAERTAVDPGWPRHAHLTYAPAVRAGNLLFLSGQLALDPDTGELRHPGNVVAQCRAIYDNVARALAAAGVGLEAVVKTVEYVTPEGLPDYPRTAEVRKQVFTPPYPASTGVVCDRLVRPGAVLEVDALAVLA